MTYSSLSLRRYPVAVGEAEMEASWTKSERVIDLAPFSDRLFPHEAAAWARERGLQVYFVDNDWVRVVIGGSGDLVDFARRIVAGDNVQRLIAETDMLPGRLVIEAEAF